MADRSSDREALDRPLLPCTQLSLLTFRPGVGRLPSNRSIMIMQLGCMLSLAFRVPDPNKKDR